MLIRLAVVPAFLALVGCQPAEKPSDFTRETGREQIEVRDSWRQYAQSNYAGELLVEMRNLSDIRFIEPVSITATRDVKTGQIELITLGSVDATTIAGKRLRHPFYVSWKETLGGWKITERQILEGRTPPASAQPADPLPSIAPKPATQPAAP